MANRLSALFDERLKRQGDLIASPPQSLESISTKPEEQNFALRRLKEFENVVPKVDYSDFSNFVFFNSALDYFNITGELLLNAYPYDGTVDEVQKFRDELDDYQRFVIDEAWPHHGGHLRFNTSVSSSYVIVDDQGTDSGVSRGALLSPGTGSWGIELWCVPPPALAGNSAMVALQKVSGSGHGYSVYFSGSNVYFRMVSGSTTGEVAAPAVPGQVSYYACSYDHETSYMSFMTGSATEFPVAVASSSSGISGRIAIGSSRLIMGSGTLSGKTMAALTGALDNVRIWNTVITTSDVSSSFNATVHAQANLVGVWRFNETNTTSSLYPAGGDDVIVLDHSGHRLNGRIQNYYNDIRASGSLVPFEAQDPVLFFNAPEVQSYIAEQQVSGTDFDRNSDNIITSLIPGKFFELEDDSQVLENFLYILAREFDIIKVRIDQFVNVLRTNYTDFNQAPDALLVEAGKFFGWDFTGNFLNADAFQYLLGKGVLANVENNKELDIKLFEIKNEFWRRTLNNLLYIYKSKGTRESIEALLRIYGVNQNFVRLKEYGLKQNTGIGTFRISGEKSVHALTFGSGSVTGTNYVRSNHFNNVAETIETRVRFPTTGTVGMQATLTTGSIWTLLSGSTAEPMVYRLFYTKDSVGNQTGSLILTSSNGQLVLSNVGIFDNTWYNVAVVRDHRSSSLSIEVRSIDDGAVNKHMSASTTAASFDSGSRNWIFWLGSTGSLSSQMWAQEVRVWDEPLSTVELNDHALNFQSYGAEEVNGLQEIGFHWRLFENETASAGGTLVGKMLDVSGRGVSGSGYGFIPSVSPYVKFLNEYNFIAPPDYGWNEEKVRVLDSSVVKPADAFTDNRNVALEFNMVDALNEDISQIVATLDGFNNSIGLPVNRYRDSYVDLVSLRENYFKRLNGRLNFRLFADMLEFFDSSFIEMVRRLIPADAHFLGAEFVVESHMLERNKLQWNYRRAPAKFEPLGIIKVWVRT